MKITLNQQATDLQANATVADALAQMQAKPPFAVAVNTIFVPRTQYAAHMLNEGDKMEVISPVSGG